MSRLDSFISIYKECESNDWYWVGNFLVHMKWWSMWRKQLQLVTLSMIDSTHAQVRDMTPLLYSLANTAGQHGSHWLPWAELNAAFIGKVASSRTNEACIRKDEALAKSGGDWGRADVFFFFDRNKTASSFKWAFVKAISTYKDTVYFSHYWKWRNVESRPRIEEQPGDWIFADHRSTFKLRNKEYSRNRRGEQQ